MDILHMVDRLEELFNHSKPIPLTRNVMVDENAFMDIIDQMRISIPDDIKKAQQVLAQKDRILAQAQEEANRTVQLAREKAEKMLEKSEIFQTAQERVAQVADQARAEAAQTQQDADHYVMETLTKLEGELVKIMSQVQNGIRLLEESFQTEEPQAEEPQEENPE